MSAANGKIANVASTTVPANYTSSSVQPSNIGAVVFILGFLGILASNLTLFFLIDNGSSGQLVIENGAKKTGIIAGVLALLTIIGLFVMNMGSTPNTLIKPFTLSLGLAFISYIIATFALMASMDQIHLIRNG